MLFSGTIITILIPSHCVLLLQYSCYIFRVQAASMRTLLVTGVEKVTTTSPRNILIQSVAGGGKSTLCNRLAYL